MHPEENDNKDGGSDDDGADKVQEASPMLKKDSSSGWPSVVIALAC